MATAANPLGIKDTKCTICCEMFTEPKLLPCSHVFCQACLILNLQESSQQALCPDCGYIIAKDPRRQHGEGWELVVVSTLPTQMDLKALVESTRLLSKSHKCSICLTKRASSFCLTCGDLLCKSCTKMHRNMSVTSQHKAESLASMTPERMAASLPTFCSIHITEPAHLFCPAHNTIICRVCARSPEHHGSCTVTVNKQFKMKGEQKNKVPTVVDLLGIGGMNVTDAIRFMDRQKAEVEKQRRQTIAAVDSNCDNMVNAVRVFRRRMKQRDLENAVKAKARMAEAKNKMLAHQESLVALKETIQRFGEELSSNPHLLSELPALKAKIKESNERTAILTEELESAREMSARQPLEQTMLDRLESLIDNLNSAGRTDQQTLCPSCAKKHNAAKLWQFHSNHGREIVLQNAEMTAAHRGMGDHGGNIVVSSQPMEINTLYEVHLDQVDDNQPSYFPCGVLFENPTTLTLPDTMWCGWHGAVVFCQAVYDRGTEKADEALGDQLFQLPADSHVGVMVDSARRLHLFINRTEVTAVPNVPSHCFAFFELLKRYKQVTTSPKHQVI